MLIDDVKTGKDNTEVVFVASSVIVAGQGSLGLGAGRCLMKISDLKLACHWYSWYIRDEETRISMGIVRFRPLDAVLRSGSVGSENVGMYSAARLTKNLA